MELLNLKNFQKAYPNLLKKINEVRGKPITDEYSSSTKIPIQMKDAEIVDSYLETNNRQINNIGFEKAQKIFNVVKQNPNMENWLKILYPQRIVSNKKNKNIIDKNTKCVEEAILFISVKNGHYKCVDKHNKDWTKIINDQEKIKYAYKKKRLMRIRKYSDGIYRWRIVKEKFVKE